MGGNERYVNVCPSPEALTLEQIYEQLRSAYPETGRDVVKWMLTEVDGVADDLARLHGSLGRLGEIWRAQSTERGGAAITQIQAYAAAAREHARALNERFGSFFDELGTAKAQVPEPIDRFAGASTPIVGPVRVLLNESLYQVLAAEARQIYARVYEAAVAVDSTTPAFDPPPRVTTDRAGVAEPTVRSDDPSTGWPTRSVAPGTPTPPAADPAAPGPPTAPPPAVPAPLTPAPTPPGASGSAGVAPSPAAPLMPPGAPGSAGAGVGVVGPPVSGFSPAGGGRFGHGDAGPRSDGRVGGGSGPGRGGSLAHRSQLDTIRSSGASRVGGAVGSGGRGTGAPGPFGGGPGARDEDRERRRPAFLVADDPNDLVGPLDKVAPPVIGAPHADQQ